MKQSILSYISGLFLFAFLLIGCERGEEQYTTNPRENFEALWKILDEHYCFFDYKQIDWNEVHDRYSKHISDTMSQYQLFDSLTNMICELRDGHTNLISNFNVGRYWSWYEDYPDNFNSHILQNYLGTGMDYNIAGGLKYRKLSNNQIGYAYYGSFTSGVGENNLDYMFLHFKDCKGLILDVRDNGGGMLTYSDRIASRFLEEEILTGYIQHKTGTGHGNFSSPYPLYLAPSSRIRWLRPVVVLTNRRCFSAANDFVQKMRMMPYVTILGDRTGGGSGFPFSSELPNGWSIRFSASPMLDASKQSTEFGIDPDIQVYMTAEDMEKGKDTLIEEAIKLLLKESETKKPD